MQTKTKIAKFARFLIFLFFFGFLIISTYQPPQEIQAASAKTWDGEGEGDDWCTAANWSNDTIPTDADDPTIDMNVTVTTSGCASISFVSLIIGGTNTAKLILEPNIATGTNITIGNNGTLEQKNTTTQTISGTLTIQNGGTLTHTDNSTTQSYEVDFSAANIDVQSGGSIDVDAKGFDGSEGAAQGGSDSGAGGGGAHGGDGGKAQAWNGNQAAGGVANCDITNPVTMGSGGNGRNGTIAGTGSQGGGYIKLNASGTLTINGEITADGANGNGTNGGLDDAGGAGGGINITTGSIAGNAAGGITFTGGNGLTSGIDGGSGGGGCMLLTYTTDSGSSNILNAANVSMNGGTAGAGGGQAGGAGIYLVKTPSTDGTLFVKNNGTAGATSTQNVNSLQLDALTILTQGDYKITSGKTLVLDTNTPMANSDNTGSLIIDDNATFTPTTNLTIDDITLEFHRSATWTNSSNTDLTIGANGILDMRDFTVENALSLKSVTINDAGMLTHGANSTTAAGQQHIINISTSGNFTINTGDTTGGIINVDGKGYLGEEGPGEGNNHASGSAGTGGGHGGHGGVNSTWAGRQVAGGVTYCDITNPSTIGSGGGLGGTTDAGVGGGAPGANSEGGGLIKINVSGTLTINGTITADGANGTADPLNGGYGEGGGAGGGINITANTIAGTPKGITFIGGNGVDNSQDGGGGGGGCMKLVYTTDSGSSNIINATAISMYGGSTGGQAGVEYGGAGIYLVKTPSTDGTLFVKNNGTAGAVSSQTANSVTVDSITILTQGDYKITSGKTLVLDTNTPMANSDNTGSLIIDDNATFTPTTNLTIDDITLELHRSATWTNSSNTDLTIGANGILDMRDFTVENALSLKSITINDAGMLTHGANSTTAAGQQHIINISTSGNFTIDTGDTTGGIINVDGKGYAGAEGTGEGGGNACSGGGAGHGGDGGNSQTWGGCTSSGGTAYCTAANPTTIGSGGGGESDAISGTGSQGGGFIKLNISGTLAINGTITVDGIAGNGTSGGYDDGGGAGGGLNITAGSITGTPKGITLTGGDGNDANIDGGSGGGGCALFNYSSSASISTDNINVTGGEAGNSGGGAGSAGTKNVLSLTPSAPTTLYTHKTNAQSGDANPRDLGTLTPVFSAICETPAGNCNKYRIQVDDNGDFLSPIWDNGAAGTAMNATADNARSPNITYAGGQLIYNTDYYWRIKFWNDNGEGTWSDGSDYFEASFMVEFYTFGEGGAIKEGSEIDIEWGSSGGEDDETVKIEYSTDNFAADINQIVASVNSASSGSDLLSYTWTVPTAQGICGAATCNTVKLRISSNNDGNNTKFVSNNTFTIQEAEATTIKTGRSYEDDTLYNITGAPTFSAGNVNFSLETWYNSNWTRRKPITVTNNVASELTNYQVQVVVSYDSDMQADFDDIRFTSSDKETLIDHWLQEKVDSTSATFWVEVPSIGASGTATIYMYYGNAETSNASNASNTLLWYDDFSTNTLGNYTQVGGTWSWNASGYVTDPAGNTEAALTIPTVTETNVYVEVVGRSNDDDGTGAMLRANGVTTYYACNSNPQGDTYGIAENEGRDSFISSGATGTQNNTDWITTSIAAYGSNLYCWYENGVTSLNTSTTDTSLTTGTVGALSWYNDVSGDIDSIWAKKYVNPEPSTATGSETAYVDPTPPTLTFKAGHTFASINSFTATTSGTGNVKFQVSADNGVNWKYCVGNVLTTATDGYNHSNTAAELTNTCLASLPIGTINIRAYLSTTPGNTITLQDLSFVIILNQSPTASSTLYSNNSDAQTGDANPINLTDTTPSFSFICNDPDNGDILNKARIQVSTNNTFASITHWDSGAAGTTITNCITGNRSSDIVYGSFGTAPTQALALNDGAITYYWRIKLWDDSGAEGEWSSGTATFTLMDVPTTPSNANATYVSDNEITVTWTDNSTTETGYKIERRDDTGSGFGAYNQIGTVAEDITTYSDTTTASNNKYQYKIRAYNAAGNSDYDTDADNIITSPATPTSITSTKVSDTQIVITWSDNANFESGYKIERKTDAGTGFGNFIQIASITANSESFTDNATNNPSDPPQAEERYQYRVRSYVATANSNYLTDTTIISTIQPVIPVPPCTDSDGDKYTGNNQATCLWSGFWQRDCNDSNAQINPGAVEICDNIDNDCDGSIDEDEICTAICSETDSGIDYSIKGTTNGPDELTNIKADYSDSCGSAIGKQGEERGEWIAEKHCSTKDGKTYVHTQWYQCPGICKNGTCIEEIPPETPEDETEPELKPETELEPEPEFKPESGTDKPSVKPICTETDKGIDYKTFGTTAGPDEQTNVTGNYSDFCSEKIGGTMAAEGDWMGEKHCSTKNEKTYVHTQWYRCPGTCKNGACVEVEKTRNVVIDDIATPKQPSQPDQPPAEQDQSSQQGQPPQQDQSSQPNQSDQSDQPPAEQDQSSQQGQPPQQDQSSQPNQSNQNNQSDQSDLLENIENKPKILADTILSSLSGIIETATGEQTEKLSMLIETAIEATTEKDLSKKDIVMMIIDDLDIEKLKDSIYKNCKEAEEECLDIYKSEITDSKTNLFDDLSSDDKNYEIAVEALLLGVITDKDKTNSTYDADEKVTVQEVLEMIINALQITGNENKKDQNDATEKTGTGGVGGKGTAPLYAVSAIEIACEIKLTDCNDSKKLQSAVTKEKLKKIIKNVKRYMATYDIEKQFTQDSDGDGLSDSNETDIYKTDPFDTDTDKDSLSDYSELKIHSTNPLKQDTDEDGLTDGIEINTHKTDPTNKDSDNDQFTDKHELNFETDPLNPSDYPNDNDSDGIDDNWEQTFGEVENGEKDADEDGVPDIEEYKYGTDPKSPDTDNDGFPDGKEIYDFKTDPKTFTKSEEINVQITNLLDGHIIVDNTPLIKGTAREKSIAQILIMNEFGHQKKLGEAKPDENNIFVFETKDPLQDGDYVLMVREINLKTKEVRNSIPIIIVINTSMNVNVPDIKKLGGKKVPKDVLNGKRKVFLRTILPELEGKTDIGNQIIAIWQSAVSTSVLIADTKAGNFKIKPPRVIEEGEHTVIIYSIREKDKIVSETQKIQFEIEKGSTLSGLSSGNLQAMRKSGPQASFMTNKKVNDTFIYILIGLAVFAVVRYLISENFQGRKKS